MAIDKTTSDEVVSPVAPAAPIEQQDEVNNPLLQLEDQAPVPASQTRSWDSLDQAEQSRILKKAYDMTFGRLGDEAEEFTSKLTWRDENGDIRPGFFPQVFAMNASNPVHSVAKAVFKAEKAWNEVGLNTNIRDWTWLMGQNLISAREAVKEMYVPTHFEGLTGEELGQAFADYPDQRVKAIREFVIENSGDEEYWNKFENYADIRSALLRGAGEYAAETSTSKAGLAAGFAQGMVLDPVGLATIAFSYGSSSFLNAPSRALAASSAAGRTVTKLMKIESVANEMARGALVDAAASGTMYSVDPSYNAQNLYLQPGFGALFGGVIAAPQVMLVKSHISVEDMYRNNVDMNDLARMGDTNVAVDEWGIPTGEQPNAIGYSNPRNGAEATPDSRDMNVDEWGNRRADGPDIDFAGEVDEFGVPVRDTSGVSFEYTGETSSPVAPPTPRTTITKTRLQQQMDSLDDNQIDDFINELYGDPDYTDADGEYYEDLLAKLYNRNQVKRDAVIDNLSENELSQFSTEYAEDPTIIDAIVRPSPEPIPTAAAQTVEPKATKEKARKPSKSEKKNKSKQMTIRKEIKDTIDSFGLNELEDYWNKLLADPNKTEAELKYYAEVFDKKRTIDAEIVNE